MLQELNWSFRAMLSTLRSRKPQFTMSMKMKWRMTNCSRPWPIVWDARSAVSSQQRSLSVTSVRSSTAVAALLRTRASSAAGPESSNRSKMLRLSNSWLIPQLSLSILVINMKPVDLKRNKHSDIMITMAGTLFLNTWKAAKRSH